MKVTCSILFVFLMFCKGWAQDIANGYIILPNGDTLIGKINFKRAVSWQEVSFINADGLEKKFRAQKDEVKGYGFETFGMRKNYIFFNLNQRADSRWFERICSGKSYSLYRTSVTGSFGTVDVTSSWYVLQKPTGEFVFLENCGLCGWRQKLAEFLTDNPDASAQVESIKAKELGDFLRRICK